MATNGLIAGLLAKFESIKERAMEIQVEFEGGNPNPLGSNEIYARKYIPNVLALVESYQKADLEFQSLTHVSVIEHVSTPEKPVPASWGTYTEFFSVLDRVIVGCEAAIAHIGSIASNIPVELKDKLDSLRGRIAIFEESNLNLFKHLSKAVDEQEAGHYLGGTLIAAKVTDFVLDKLEGVSDEDKVNYLVEKHVLEKRLKDNFVRGLRRSRNFYTHDINMIPESEEALGILSIACELAIKFSQIR